MIVILIILILVLCGLMLITYISIDFAKEKKAFEKRMEMLKKVMKQNQQEQKIQSNQMVLSEAVMKTIKETNFILNKAIVELNMNLFEELFPKKTT